MSREVDIVPQSRIRRLLPPECRLSHSREIRSLSTLPPLQDRTLDSRCTPSGKYRDCGKSRALQSLCSLRRARNPLLWRTKTQDVYYVINASQTLRWHQKERSRAVEDRSIQDTINRVQRIHGILSQKRIPFAPPSCLNL